MDNSQIELLYYSAKGGVEWPDQNEYNDYMCFSIPLKVLDVTGIYATLEGGARVRLGKEMTTQKGNYVRILGNVIVDTLTKSEGNNVRRLIKKLNTSL